jgi:hypothetical protein
VGPRTDLDAVEKGKIFLFAGIRNQDVQPVATPTDLPQSWVSVIQQMTIISLHSRNQVIFPIKSVVLWGKDRLFKMLLGGVLSYERLDKRSVSLVSNIPAWEQATSEQCN